MKTRFKHSIRLLALLPFASCLLPLTAADTKITDLPAISALHSTDVFPVVDLSGTAATKKATFTQLSTLLGSTYVPLTRTINSHALSSDLTLGFSDFSGTLSVAKGGFGADNSASTGVPVFTAGSVTMRALSTGGGTDNNAIVHTEADGVVDVVGLHVYGRGIYAYENEEGLYTRQLYLQPTSTLCDISFADAGTGRTLVLRMPNPASADVTKIISLPTLPTGLNGDTIVTRANTETLTNKTISGASNTLSSIGNSSLTNSTITIAGTATALGGSITFDAMVPSQTGNSGKYLTTNGTTTSWGTVSTGITIGTTAITSGTSGRILYDNAGVVGEMTTTGSGTVVALATSPTFTTPILGTPTSGTLTNCTGLPAASVVAGSFGTGAFTHTGSAGSSALTITGATQTSSFPALAITQTWNNSATTFTAISANVTSTASAASSLLMDLQVASASKFSVDKTGIISSAASSIFLTGGTYGFSIYNVTGGYWCISRPDQANGTQSFEWSGGGANGNIRGDFGIGTAMGSADAVLSRRAAKVIGIVNSIAGSSSAGNAFSLGSQTVAQLTAASTAGAGALAFVTDANSTTAGSTVAGSGSNKALVVSDGTNWKIVVGF